MTILPLTYLGSVDYFAHLAGGDCVIDIGENWVKQTARNRCEIMTSGGVAVLTVPVHGYGRKMAIKEVRIDNSKRWQHTHWVSLVSAYRNSPYFDHYEERLAPVYTRRFDFLVDLNLELLSVATSILRLGGEVVRVSENYIDPTSGDLDLRGKKALRRVEFRAETLYETLPKNLSETSPNNSLEGLSENPHYTQVFSDRMPFTGGLSIVDLLMCEGPTARELLPARDRY